MNESLNQFAKNINVTDPTLFSECLDSSLEIINAIEKQGMFMIRSPYPMIRFQVMINI